MLTRRVGLPTLGGALAVPQHPAQGKPTEGAREGVLRTGWREGKRDERGTEMQLPRKKRICSLLSGSILIIPGSKASLPLSEGTAPRLRATAFSTQQPKGSFIKSTQTVSPLLKTLLWISTIVRIKCIFPNAAYEISITSPPPHSHGPALLIVLHHRISKLKSTPEHMPFYLLGTFFPGFS